MKVCKSCNVVVKNMRRHKARDRCEAQHHRGGYRLTGVSGGGGFTAAYLAEKK